MPLQDVKIKIEANKPGALSDLGTPLILAYSKAGTVSYTEYADETAIGTTLGENHSAYKLALVVANQGQYRPDKIAVAIYNDETDAAAVLRQFYDRDWYFALLDDGTVEQKEKLSDIVEGKAFKMIAHQVTTVAEAAQMKTKKYDRTILFFSEPENADEYPHAAFVGANGSRTVGSITWKFKGLVGVTPLEDTTKALAAMAENANIYIDTSGEPKTREGVVVSGEFIDVIHGLDWIIVNGEKAIQTVFNNSPKIGYTDAGIAKIVAALTDVFELAGRNEIIDQAENGQYQYTINALSRSEIIAAERASRQYNGISFEFDLAGAIHGARMAGVVNY